jgi:hypothetical protein
MDALSWMFSMSDAPLDVENVEMPVPSYRDLRGEKRYESTNLARESRIVPLRKSKS